MAAEVVTVTCVRHRRKVTRGRRKPVTGAVILHEGGNLDQVCDSERFLVRREQVVGRDQADGELLVLAMMREHADAAAREDEHHGR